MSEDRGAGKMDFGRAGRHSSPEKGDPAESREGALSRGGIAENIRRTVRSRREGYRRQ